MSSIAAITPHACFTGDCATTIPVITGSGFIGATGVHFAGLQYAPGSFDATSFVVNSDSQITCHIPANGWHQQYDVVVRLPTGDVTLAAGFTVGGLPTVSVVYRQSIHVYSGHTSLGSTAGGQLVTLNGTWLDETTEVRFGGVAATSLVVSPFANDSAGGQQITCTLPAHAAGTVDVQVVSRYRNVTKVGWWEYGEPPRIDYVQRGDNFYGFPDNPVSGPNAGDYSLVLTGEHFTTCYQTIQVGKTWIAGTPVIHLPLMTKDDTVFVTKMAPTTCRSGRANLALENAYGVGVAPVQLGIYEDDYIGHSSLTYYEDHCRVRVYAPDGSSRLYAQTIGNNVSPLVTSIHLRDEDWFDRYIDPTTGRWVVSWHIAVNDNGLNWYQWSAIAEDVVDLGLPNPLAITPGWDWIEGGASCRIDGAQFVGGGAYEVYFGATLATGFVLVDDSTITVTAPAHAAGVVDVSVVGTSGTGILPSAFEYRRHPKRRPVLYVHT